VLVTAFIVYLIILWRTNVIRKKEQEKLRINKLLAEYQMKALTAQMNPHFIFNAINSIQNFIIQNHSTLAYDYLIKFSKLIRLVLNNSKENEISLQQELETLAIYVELEQLRFENSFDYQVSIAPQLETESIVIPALLLQPYIENAIWHGLMPLKNRKGAISLTIVEQDEFLKIIITDNGVGRKASDLIKKKIVNKNHQSIGMELTGKRIEVFGQESKFSLQIIDNYDPDNNSTGTTVEIVLPMIEMY
jgi:LytS/YehU family sensor histidine kinase